MSAIFASDEVEGLWTWEGIVLMDGDWLWAAAGAAVCVLRDNPESWEKRPKDVDMRDE